MQEIPSDIILKVMLSLRYYWSIFRHASVSSTYPCPLVSKSVSHTFGFPISVRPSVATVTKEVATLTKEVATTQPLR